MSPVEATLKSDIKASPDGGADYTFYSNEKNVTKKKTEINKVNKVVFTIKGQKSVTLKQPPKGWDSRYIYKFYKVDVFNKDYTAKFYDKKGKLIKSTKGKVGRMSKW